MSKIKAFGEAEWVSEKTKELDKLGGGFHQNLLSSAACVNSRFDYPYAGKNRPPVKRGDSLKMKLQWLEVYTLPRNLFLLEIFLSFQPAPTDCPMLSWST